MRSNGAFAFAASVIALCTVAILTGACSAGRDVELGAADDGRQIQVDRGGTIVVRLESNPTTGYSWAYVPAGDGILDQQGEAEFRDGGQGGQRVGAGGVEVLRFKAQSSGTTTLQLSYRRPWEEDAEPERVFAVQVTVR